MNEAIQQDIVNGSEATRARLVAAGLALFGSAGYDAVTTRLLATCAKVNQAAIPYHFGGKQGVYVAVAQHLCDTTGGEVRRAVEASRAALTAGRLEVDEILADFVATCVHVIAGSEQGLLQYAFFIREQLSPSVAFDLIFDQILLPVHQLACELVARLKGSAADAPETMLLAQAFLAQVSGFVAGRVLLQRRLGEHGLDQTVMLRTVREFTRAAARGL